ncbi:Sulfite exporter TauE/SafE [Oceanibacterium hippocampi]|uniref:Probable membrane transporter protein n=2 Tax=Oceanibacterium hippocampi TaxID=745714 RepID=A0A1Y5SER8_9PROT|nr:Sulfite exporter TauE/SafE [Oceanibacterium hippocampi]
MVAIALTFLLAGGVKGVVGLGLPTVSLALLATVFDLTTAMALMIVPSLATNLWQAATGGNARALIRRLWPFLLAATATIWIGAAMLTRLDVGLLTALLGVLLVAYAALGLAGVRITIRPPRERWAGPGFGAANGLLTGLTGSFVVPGVMYLQAIGLPRDMLVQAMGMLFAASTAALGLALGGNRLLDGPLALTSTLALLPAILGMILGQRLRQWLSETAFRRVFFVAILALGLNILVRAGFG